MEYWVKMWPILVTLVGVIGSVFTLKSEVDNIKENLGPPGSLPVIENKIEQLGEQYKDMREILKNQEDERKEVIKVMRDGQEKVDSLIDLLVNEREKKK